MTLTLRKATVGDVPRLQKLINGYAHEGVMLPRSLHSLYEHLRDYTVACVDEEVAGGISLHVSWSDLAEIRSLAVDADHEGRGIGTRLVAHALEEARSLGLQRVFVLTFVPDFFAHLGFDPVDKSDLPHKIWQECVHCVHFPDCGEVPLTIELESEAAEAAVRGLGA